MSSETLFILLPEIILILFATGIYVLGAFLPGREGWHWLTAGGLLLAAIALYQQERAEPTANAQQGNAQQIVRTIDGKVYSGLVKQEDPFTLVIVREGQVVTIPKDQIESRKPAGMSADAAVERAEPVANPIGSLEARRHDEFSTVIRWSVLALGLALVMMSSGSVTGPLATEFLGSLLLMIAGLMLVALSEDLVSVFVGLELVSIPTYIILYLGRGGTSAQEATTKYFFLSILSSALLLYGFSFWYGVAGSTDLSAGARALLAPTAGAATLTFAKIALVFIFAGLGFRITVVPFHFYAPDVYQGTSHLNAGVLAVIPKVAGLTALVRIVIAGLGGSSDALHQLAGFGWMVVLVLSLITMTLGNLVALWQQNIRRLLAYSSIAHAGYMLIGVAVAIAVAGGAEGSRLADGVGAMLFYLLVYAAATLGAFALLAWLSDTEKQIDNVDDLAGLWRNHPWAAAVMAIFMFSLTGLPPFAGFFGKFSLFLGAVGIDAGSTAQGGLRPWFLALAIVGVLNAAISAGYYLRVVSVMFFRPSLAVPAARGGPGAAATALLCAGLVVALGSNPAAMMDAAMRASAAAQMFLPAGEPAATAIEDVPAGQPKPAPSAQPAFAPAEDAPPVG